MLLDYYNRFMVAWYLYRIRKSCNVPTKFGWYWRCLAWPYIRTGVVPKNIPGARVLTWEELEKISK